MSIFDFSYCIIYIKSATQNGIEESQI